MDLKDTIIKQLAAPVMRKVTDNICPSGTFTEEMIGFPLVDSLTISFGKWRTEALKAYGNAIVPQVMYELFRAIEITESNERI